MYNEIDPECQLPPPCTCCQDEPGRDTPGGWLCKWCYADWLDLKWVDHCQRVSDLIVAMRPLSPPSWYDPDSFEGRLTELEEELPNE